MLFKDGLSWIFVFEGRIVNGKPMADDGAVVVMGDLAGVYQHDLMLFRGVQGLKEIEREPEIKAMKKQLASLAKDTPAAERRALEGRLRSLQMLSDATMMLDDGGGAFFLCDFYGNPQPGRDGKIVVPLNDLGYFLKTDGSPGSFDKLLAALKNSRIEGYEPLDIIAYDFLDRIENKPALRLRLANILNRPIKGRLAVKVGGLTLQPAEQEMEFKPHESRDISLAVVGGGSVPSNIYPISVVFDAGADGKAVHEEELHVNLIAKRTIAVDGDLADWKDILPHTVRNIDMPLGGELTEKARVSALVETGTSSWYHAFAFGCEYTLPHCRMPANNWNGDQRSHSNKVGFLFFDSHVKLQIEASHPLNTAAGGSGYYADGTPWRADGTAAFLQLFHGDKRP